MMEQKQETPASIERMLDRITPKLATVGTVAGRVGRARQKMLAEDDGVVYVTTNTHGTIVREQPKLKGKAARKQERRTRQQLRKQALREGREWHCAKWA